MGLARLAPVGIIGVAFFFQITGFLFWHKFLVSPGLDIQPMVRGRVFRIVPALLVTYAVIVALLIIVAPNAFAIWDLRRVRDFLSVFSIGGYRREFTDWVVYLAGPTWTLKWEIIFYALLPFLFGMRRLIGPLSFHLLTPFLLYFWIPDHSVSQAWLPDNALIYIWSGTLLAEARMLMERVPTRLVRLADLTLHALALPTFVFLILRAEFIFTFPQIMPIFLVMLSLVRGGTFYGLLRLPAFQFLGKISY